MKNKFKIILLGSAMMSSMIVASEKSNIDENRMIFAKEIWVENQENPLAQLYIAEQHYIKKDFDKSLEWYLRSAEQNNVSAINNVELMIERNEGTSENMDSVVKFLSAKALKGDLFSQMYLGDIYRDGRYQKDLEKSYFWYNQAASQGDSHAEYYIGNMTTSGLGTFQNIPKGLRFLEKVAEKGHTGAMFNIAKVYKLGFNIGKNHKAASKWFSRAAKEGHVESMYEIADSLERGFGVDKNEKEALEWFETAALHGHTKSAYRAGILHLYLSPTGDSDYTLGKATDWLTLAGEEGNLDAQLRMGDLNYEGKFGLEKDYVKAAHWYSLATAQDSKIALKKESMIYRLGGFGVKRNTEKYKNLIGEFYKHKKLSLKKSKDRLKLFNYDVFQY
jgi:TPR repeat protein